MADLLTRFATVSFVIESLIQSTAGFGVHVIVAEDQSLPAAARFVTYQTTDAVDAAEGLSELTSAAANAARAALTARPTAGAVTVINQDVSGSAESAEDALDAAEAAGLAFYWITLVSADAADIVSAVTYAASNEKMVIARSADADWKTAGAPSGFSTVVSSTRLVVIFDDTSSPVYPDMQFAQVQAATDLDLQSGDGSVKLTLGTMPDEQTDTVAATIYANNANPVYGINGSAAGNAYIRSAVVIQGASTGGAASASEQMYVQVTADWLKAGILQKIGQLLDRYTAANRKFPLNDDGVELFLGEARDQSQTGVDAGHLTPSDSLPLGYSWSGSINVSSKTITLTGSLNILDTVVALTITGYLGRYT